MLLDVPFVTALHCGTLQMSRGGRAICYAGLRPSGPAPNVEPLKDVFEFSQKITLYMPAFLHSSQFLVLALRSCSRNTTLFCSANNEGVTKQRCARRWCQPIA